VEIAMTGSRTSPERADALAWLRETLVDEIDDPMKVAGFKRAARSVSFSRHWDEGRQKIAFELIVRPRYASDSIQISLSISFVHAGVSAVARRMLPEGDEDVVRKNVIERSVLDQVMRNPPVLVFRNERELRDSVSTLKIFINCAVLPYADARSSVEGLVRENVRSLMRNTDDGFARGPRPVVLAAMQEFLGCSADALAILEFPYPPDGLERTYYSRAFRELIQSGH
jgi:hypothetical protein